MALSESNGVLAEPNHTPEFWLRVARTLPEYEQRKAWLAELGGRHVLLPEQAPALVTAESGP